VGGDVGLGGYRARQGHHVERGHQELDPAAEPGRLPEQVELGDHLVNDLIVLAVGKAE
jgi:hypothetical protein